MTTLLLVCDPATRTVSRITDITEVEGEYLFSMIKDGGKEFTRIMHRFIIDTIVECVGTTREVYYFELSVTNDYNQAADFVFQQFQLNFEKSLELIRSYGDRIYPTSINTAL